MIEVFCFSFCSDSRTSKSSKDAEPPKSNARWFCSMRLNVSTVLVHKAHGSPVFLAHLTNLFFIPHQNLLLCRSLSFLPNTYPLNSGRCCSPPSRPMSGIASTVMTGYEPELYGLYRLHFLLVTSWIELSLPRSLLENAARLCGAVYVRFRVRLGDHL